MLQKEDSDDLSPLATVYHTEVGQVVLRSKKAILKGFIHISSKVSGYLYYRRLQNVEFRGGRGMGSKRDVPFLKNHFSRFVNRRRFVSRRH